MRPVKTEDRVSKKAKPSAANIQPVDPVTPMPTAKKAGQAVKQESSTGNTNTLMTPPPCSKPPPPKPAPVFGKQSSAVKTDVPVPKPAPPSRPVAAAKTEASNMQASQTFANSQATTIPGDVPIPATQMDTLATNPTQASVHEAAQTAQAAGPGDVTTGMLAQPTAATPTAAAPTTAVKTETAQQASSQPKEAATPVHMPKVAPAIQPKHAMPVKVEPKAAVRPSTGPSPPPAPRPKPAPSHVPTSQKHQPEALATAAQPAELSNVGGGQQPQQQVALVKAQPPKEPATTTVAQHQPQSTAEVQQPKAPASATAGPSTQKAQQPKAPAVSGKQPQPASTVQANAGAAAPTNGGFEVQGNVTPIQYENYKDQQKHFMVFKRQVTGQNASVSVPPALVTAWQQAVQSKSRAAKNALFKTWCQAGGDWSMIFVCKWLYTLFCNPS